MERSRLVVLVSGSGSNLQAILDATATGALHGDVVAVVSNRTDAYGLDRARRAGVDTVEIERSDGEARHDYDERLAHAVAGYDPDWVILAGWMRLLTMTFLARFPDRVVNLHPALPGDLPGTHAIERAWEEACAGHRTESGVMVHLVPDEGVDDGPVLATSRVPIDTSGTLEAFEARMHATEHRLLVDTLTQICTRQPTPTQPDRLHSKDMP
ncbi:MAG: phosphoribosylglycinamide formyltransferase [Ilumatobacter sp.]|uniref:phosphoribosylglycinamide formyltransferase n=1 Tax=Ilumatobacter sp. TaxID=1967498 RepID=UPI00391CD793